MSFKLAPIPESKMRKERIVALEISEKIKSGEYLLPLKYDAKYPILMDLKGTFIRDFETHEELLEFVLSVTEELKLIEEERKDAPVTLEFNSKEASFSDGKTTLRKRLS
jgi:hypothetical protein